MIEVSYLMKRKISRFIFKYFLILKFSIQILYNKVINDQNFVKLTEGLDKGWETRQCRIWYSVRLWFSCSVMYPKYLHLGRWEGT